MKDFKKYFTNESEIKLTPEIEQQIRKLGLANSIAEIEYSPFDFEYSENKFVYLYIKNTITFAIQDDQLMFLIKSGVFANVGFDSKRKQFYLVFKERK